MQLLYQLGIFLIHQLKSLLSLCQSAAFDISTHRGGIIRYARLIRSSTTRSKLVAAKNARTDVKEVLHLLILFRFFLGLPPKEQVPKKIRHLEISFSKWMQLPFKINAHIQWIIMWFYNSIILHYAFDVNILLRSA
jgi:hypothetical protein